MKKYWLLCNVVHKTKKNAPTLEDFSDFEYVLGPFNTKAQLDKYVKESKNPYKVKHIS